MPPRARLHWDTPAGTALPAYATPPARTERGSHTRSMVEAPASLWSLSARGGRPPTSAHSMYLSFVNSGKVEPSSYMRDVGSVYHDATCPMFRYVRKSQIWRRWL